MSKRTDPYASTGLLSADDADNQSFVNVAENDSPGSVMELPKEEDGSLLLSTITGQFPNAVGLKYKGSSGAWRGVRISGNVLDSPAGGWGNTLYYVTLHKSEAVKRKMEDVQTDVKDSKTKKRENKLLGDIIVLGLPFKCTEEQLKDYFTNECGELAFHEVKFDRSTGRPRGFGFIRFKSIEGGENALNKKHTIMGRTLEIRLSKKKEVPMKLFVGRIPNQVSREELQKYFSKFGELSEVYMPTPTRGFAFVTFESSKEGSLALRKDHTLQGAHLNVVIADPQGDPKRDEPVDSKSERFAWNKRGDPRDERRLNEGSYSKGLRGRQDWRDGDGIRADTGPGGLRGDRVPIDTHGDSLSRDFRDSRAPKEPRLRDSLHSRDDRVPRELRDGRSSRDERSSRNPVDERPHRELRGERYQRDGDHRGPRDFRDPVERNPMERGAGGGEGNRLANGTGSLLDILRRNRAERPRENMGRHETNDNRDNGFGDDRRVTESRGLVVQRHPHEQFQVANQFNQANKFNLLHTQQPQQLSLPNVTTDVAVRLKDMIYKFLGAQN